VPVSGESLGGFRYGGRRSFKIPLPVLGLSPVQRVETIGVLYFSAAPAPPRELASKGESLGGFRYGDFGSFCSAWKKRESGCGGG
jgi:hypothetical protein